jgi:hypothetical protein
MKFLIQVLATFIFMILGAPLAVLAFPAAVIINDPRMQNLDGISGWKKLTIAPFFYWHRTVLEFIWGDKVG